MNADDVLRDIGFPTATSGGAEVVPIVVGMQSETAVLLTDVQKYLRRWLVMRDEQYWYLAAWVLHTYVYDRGFSTPYLHIHSPVPGCGKTNLCIACAAISFNGKHLVAPTAPTLFRYMETLKGALTAFVDEADRLFAKKEEEISDIVTVLDAGYHDGATIPRTDRTKGFDVHEFSIYFPKAIAGIDERRVPPQILERCVSIRLQKARAEEIPEPFRLKPVLAAASELQPRLLAWAERWPYDDDAEQPSYPEFMTGGRDRDIWEQVLRIADLAEGPWPERLRGAAKTFHESTREGEAPVRTQLLEGIREFFATHGHGNVGTRDLIEYVVAETDVPHARWWAPDVVKAHKEEVFGAPSKAADAIWKYLGTKLAGELSGFDDPPISPTKVKLVDGRSVRGYRYDQFEPHFTRYLDAADLSKEETVNEKPATTDEPAEEPAYGVCPSCKIRRALPCDDCDPGGGKTGGK